MRVTSQNLANYFSCNYINDTQHDESRTDKFMHVFAAYPAVHGYKEGGVIPHSPSSKLATDLE